MRLQEFADADEQIKLWKLISDFVWQPIKFQTIWQEKSLIMLKKSKKC
jgi:hypothetical protein